MRVASHRQMAAKCLQKQTTTESVSADNTLRESQNTTLGLLESETPLSHLSAITETELNQGKLTNFCCWPDSNAFMDHFI